MRQKHSMRHVICTSRLNYQDTPLNQRLTELKVDAKAAQKNRTEKGIKTQDVELTRFFFNLKVKKNIHVSYKSSVLKLSTEINSKSQKWKHPFPSGKF